MHLIHRILQEGLIVSSIICNWIQVLDAIMDPVHTSFLHGQSSGIQFSKGFAEVGELEFFERGVQYLGCNTRRVDDHVWVRVNELIYPIYSGWFCFCGGWN